MQSGEAGLAGNIISAQELERILTDHLRSMEVDQTSGDGATDDDQAIAGAQLYPLLPGG
jgi:hypothetical protein